MLQQLREGLPPGAIELSAVPGLSLKKIIALHDALQDRKHRRSQSRLPGRPGQQSQRLRPKSQTKLLADIEKLCRCRKTALCCSIMLSNKRSRILQHLRACPELIEADIAGALRRRKETIRRICIVASSNQPRAVLDRFLRFPALAHTDELDESRCLARLASGLQAELDRCGAGGLHCRASRPNRLAEAYRQTRKIWHARKSVAFIPRRRKNDTGYGLASENEIYQRLGLQYIPPELREDEGEIEAASAGRLPEPLELDDIRGMTHCHTIYSDGRNSIEEMALGRRGHGHDLSNDHRSFTQRPLCPRRGD